MHGQQNITNKRRLINFILDLSRQKYTLQTNFIVNTLVLNTMLVLKKKLWDDRYQPPLCVNFRHYVRKNPSKSIKSKYNMYIWKRKFVLTVGDIT
jgi:hypothetical protein